MKWVSKVNQPRPAYGKATVTTFSISAVTGALLTFVWLLWNISHFLQDRVWIFGIRVMSA